MTTDKITALRDALTKISEFPRARAQEMSVSTIRNIACQALALTADASEDAPEPQRCDFGNPDDFNEAHTDWMQEQHNVEVGALTYNGNTVSYMYSKAKNYGNALIECCGLLGGTGDVRDRIKTLLAERDALAASPAPVAATPAPDDAPISSDTWITAQVARHLDSQYACGFGAGWNAGIEGDEEKLRRVQAMVGTRDEYAELFPAPAAPIAEVMGDEPYRTQYEMLGRIAAKDAALVIAEAALSDIGDADREPGDDLAWCERRAAEALPAVRAVMPRHSRTCNYPAEHAKPEPVESISDIIKRTGSMLATANELDRKEREAKAAAGPSLVAHAKLAADGLRADIEILHGFAEGDPEAQQAFYNVRAAIIAYLQPRGQQAGAVERAPSGYAYRYHDGIRFGTGGRSINGSYPVEAIPYWLGPPAPKPSGAVDGELPDFGPLYSTRQNAKRYEYVRKLHPTDFAMLYSQNIAGQGRFDDLVDQAIAALQPEGDKA